MSGSWTPAYALFAAAIRGLVRRARLGAASASAWNWCARAEAGLSTLLIAPTGAGKTLAGFLPSLIELAPREGGRLAPAASFAHALHVAAKGADDGRGAQSQHAVREMQLGVRIETRTGDTPPSQAPTPTRASAGYSADNAGAIVLLIASEHARVFFEDLQAVVIDEIHALAPTKRGDLLALAMARLQRWAPGHRRVGLSATVADEEGLVRMVGAHRTNPPPLWGRAARVG
jgi:ATP-dependent Lhr-like helicase